MVKSQKKIKKTKKNKVLFEDVVDIITSTKKEISKLGKKETPKPRKKSKKAIDDLVINNYPLVAFIAKRFFIPNGEPMDDLIQVGCIGLIKAAKNFNSERAVKFSTFAVPIIEGEIRHYLRDKVNVVRIPRKFLETNTKIKKFRQTYLSNNGEEPTTEIISKALNVEKQLVEDTISNINSMYTIPLSYNNVVDKRNKEGLSHIENIIGDKSVTESILDREGLKDALKMLPKREREIVYDHYFRDLGQKELALLYNTSQAYISRLIKKSCEVLKDVV